jgi:hypothetical protein
MAEVCKDAGQSRGGEPRSGHMQGTSPRFTAVQRLQPAIVESIQFWPPAHSAA